MILKFIKPRNQVFCAMVTVITMSSLTLGFNIDTARPIFFNSSSSSEDYFGYSVALHRNRDGPMALIGAPRSNSSIIGNQVYQPGALFQCSIFTTNNPKCKEISLDSYGNTYTYGGNTFSYIDKKDDMWLGVSIDVQQNTAQNDIVTCGHLWKNQYYSQHYLANGVCYIINSDLDPQSVKKLVPFVDKSKQSLIPPGIYYYAFGQVGTSAAFSEDGKYLLLGAPGFYDWAGTILSYSLNPEIKKQTYTNPIIPEPPGDEDHSPESYIGYSVTSGKFFDNNDIFVAVGAPRDGNSHGRVYIFKALKPTANKLFVHQKKEGLQFGEYFGATVLGVNLNNDDFTDLLVGSPFFSTDYGGDEGKVYVYISNGMGLQLDSELMGDSKPNARFGTSIANIKDLNQDGYNDVAIGAPYEGEGAVYIYHGASKGINPVYVQKILASDIKSSLSGFGIHISRGLDVDSNQYPDILIGAYNSSEAVLFRTRPVVHLSSKFKFTPQQINRNLTSCEFNTEKVSCVNVTTCLRYTGKHVPLVLNFETLIFMEHRSQSNIITARGFFLQSGNPVSVIKKKLKLNVGIEECQINTFYIYPNIKDFITPIQFLYTYGLIEPKTEISNFDKIFPIIDQASSTNISTSISFQTGCGNDDQCLSNLVVKAKILGKFNNEPLIIGKNSSLILDIEIVNHGEPAYLAELLIYLPSETSSINPDFCSTLSDQQNQRSNASLICNLGNPMPTNKMIPVQIKLDISKIPTNKKKINIFLEAITVSTDLSLDDNILDIPIEFKAVADISITGIPMHEQIPYDEDIEGEVSIPISHTYFVMNHGPSSLDIIDIVLSIPTSFEGVDGLVNFLSFTSLEADSGKPLTIPAKCNDTALKITSSVPSLKKPKDHVFGEGDLIAATNETTSNNYDDIMRRSINEGKSTTRSKKSADKSKSSKKRKDVTISCETAQCITIFCSAKPFKDIRKFSRITVTALLNMTLLNDILDPWYRIEFFTKGDVFIRDDQIDIQPKHHHPDTTLVKTIIVQLGPPPSEEIAQWIIFVSIGVGILLLLIILITLIKIGFFKRQQKEKMKEMMSKEEVKDDEPYLIADETENSEGDMLNNV